MLLKSLNDASFPYTYKAYPYAWKPEKGEGLYYIDSTKNYGCYFVNPATNNVELQGRNILMDCLYTSIPLANWLFVRKITCVGTLNHNCQGIPTELRNRSKRQTGRIFSNLSLRVRKERSVFTFLHCKYKIFR